MRCYLRDAGVQQAAYRKEDKTENARTAYLECLEGMGREVFVALEELPRMTEETLAMKSLASEICGEKTLQRMVTMLSGPEYLCNLNHRREYCAEGICALGGKEEIPLLRKLLVEDLTASVREDFFPQLKTDKIPAKDHPKMPLIIFPVRESAHFFLSAMAKEQAQANKACSTRRLSLSA